jgi:hypothetical protein
MEGLHFNNSASKNTIFLPGENKLDCLSLSSCLMFVGAPLEKPPALPENIRLGFTSVLPKTNAMYGFITLAYKLAIRPK